ncbi:hypothetical protein BBK36DRAFT_1163811 [Trichoderma citrinoviride]|uniref:Uncharacterized protein n=1 Tax=Trichoderma citrinoviride TaxID=58853 RepID=A0A2T4AX96_9HYPO|nr:hypothetical protein BBK36DRAFT_1163811 [Trichoderma citrinoviride]PTB61608.1 hypothetical protein BBK36DRAFT_1163811 [Trichoderma citrinoviride]
MPPPDELAKRKDAPLRGKNAARRCSGRRAKHRDALDLGDHLLRASDREKFDLLHFGDKDLSLSSSSSSCPLPPLPPNKLFCLLLSCSLKLSCSCSGDHEKDPDDGLPGDPHLDLCSFVPQHSPVGKKRHLQCGFRPMFLFRLLKQSFRLPFPMSHVCLHAWYCELGLPPLKLERIRRARPSEGRPDLAGVIEDASDAVRVGEAASPDVRADGRLPGAAA